jgi:FtsP/CotA-like multicopper oxidase with cupredoxin domain
MEEDHMLNKSHNQVHMHGARVPWTSDGFPESVFHPGEGRIFHYPNNQPAATLWYHDHAMDVTRLNVYAGLFGAYILRDPGEGCYWARCKPGRGSLGTNGWALGKARCASRWRA